MFYAENSPSQKKINAITSRLKDVSYTDDNGKVWSFWSLVNKTWAITCDRYFHPQPLPKARTEVIALTDGHTFHYACVDLSPNNPRIYQVSSRPWGFGVTPAYQYFSYNAAAAVVADIAPAERHCGRHNSWAPIGTKAKRDAARDEAIANSAGKTIEQLREEARDRMRARALHPAGKGRRR